MRRCIAVILLVLCRAVHPESLAAQVAADTTTFPPVPLSKPSLRARADPADSGFAEWRRLPLPRHDKTVAGWTIRGGDWDFLLATPRTMDAMELSHIIDTTLANCRVPLRISQSDSATVAAARPWAPFDSLVDDRPVIVISIMPVLRNFTECGWKNLGRPAMIRRGLRFVTDFTYDASRDPVSAVLLSRQRIVKPLMLARAPVMVMARGGMPAHSTDQLRLYIPYDAIAPGPNGDMPLTELLIWTKAGGEPDHIPLPGNIMRAVWWDYLRWRGARLASRDRATSTAPVAARRVIAKVPTPSDTGLKTALRREREGHDADATTIILERLSEPKLSTDDRRIALMSLASTFQADDDAPAAALVADELTSMDPCAMSGGADTKRGANGTRGDQGEESMGLLLDHTRPGARCTSMRPGAAFVRGLIPGYGQYTTWSPLAGKMVGGAVIIGLAGSGAFLLSANKYYQRYQTTLNGYGPDYYQIAADHKSEAKSIVAATVALWLASAIEAEIQERVHAARLEMIHEFWFRPVIAPAGVSGAAGMAATSSLGVAAGVRVVFR
jgi:hypothetical protein